MVTESCKVTSGTYMRHLCALFLADNWLWMVAPVAICGILAVWLDVRFIIVALMVLFVVLPMILSLLYFYYGFSPEARWSIMEKTAAFDAGGITLDFTDERMKKHVIPWDNVRHIIEKDDVLMLMLSGRRYTCLMLPTSVINPDVTQRLRQFVTQTH
jgi:hypothetical protein